MRGAAGHMGKVGRRGRSAHAKGSLGAVRVNHKYFVWSADHMASMSFG